MVVVFTDRTVVEPIHYPGKENPRVADLTLFLGHIKAGVKKADCYVDFDKNPTCAWYPYIYAYYARSTDRFTTLSADTTPPHDTDEELAIFEFLRAYVNTHWWEILLQKDNACRPQ